MTKPLWRKRSWLRGSGPPHLGLVFSPKALVAACRTPLFARLRTIFLIFLLSRSSLSSIPLVHVLWAPCVAFPAPDCPAPPLPKCLQSSRVPSRPTLGATISGPGASVPVAPAPLSFFSCNTAMSAGSWDETGGVLAASPSTRASETYPSTFDSPRTSFRHLVPELLRAGSHLHLCFPTEGSLAR